MKYFQKHLRGGVIPVDVNQMPYTEHQDEVPKDEQPIVKTFRAGDDFRLAVFNFCSDPDIPLVGFSIERIKNGESVYVQGSERIIDPSKVLLTKPAIATVPLIHIFNKQIQAEAKRASNLIAKASGKSNVTSIASERDKRMMDAALNATHNVMTSLYGDKKPEKEPITGQDSLSQGLSGALDASTAFYSALMNTMQGLFEPTIRSLGEKVALGRFETKAAPVKIM